jgi:hypothetical protein
VHIPSERVRPRRHTLALKPRDPSYAAVIALKGASGTSVPAPSYASVSPGLLAGCPLGYVIVPVRRGRADRASSQPCSPTVRGDVAGGPILGRRCSYLLVLLRVLRELAGDGRLHTPCNAGRRAMDVRGDARSPVPEAGGPGAGTRRTADSSTTRRSAVPLGLEADWDGEPTQLGVPAATSRQTSNGLSTRASVRRERSVPQASSVGPAKIGRHEHVGPMHRSGHLSNGCVDKTHSDNGS